MGKQKRKAIVAGNWKMNMTRPEAGELIKAIRPLVSAAECEVVVCVPFTDLDAAAKALKGSEIRLGAQNCHWEPSGAYTGEISVPMLRELGAEYVIVGHSERRQYFGETDQTANRRLRAALFGGLKAILCVGETLSQREANDTNDVIARQVTEGLREVPAGWLGDVVIAYEPVWAIGTGKTATAEEAGQACAFIRGLLAGICGDEETACGVTIQYGGSMNPKNAAQLLAQYDIDGGLIGGASLKAADFAAIVEAASK